MTHDVGIVGLAFSDTPPLAAPGIVYAIGPGHPGPTPSAGTGRLVADMLARRAPAIDLAPVRTARFT